MGRFAIQSTSPRLPEPSNVGDAPVELTRSVSSRFQVSSSEPVLAGGGVVVPEADTPGRSRFKVSPRDTHLQTTVGPQGLGDLDALLSTLELHEFAADVTLEERVEK